MDLTPAAVKNTEDTKGKKQRMKSFMKIMKSHLRKIDSVFTWIEWPFREDSLLLHLLTVSLKVNSST